MIDRKQQQKWHQVATVRRRESISLRNVSRRLGIPIRQLQLLENEFQDLPVSMIYRWARALRVPVYEILLDDQMDDLFSITPALRDRARMVRIMKTVEAIRMEAEDSGISFLVENLRSQLLEVMPELDSVTSWPRFGTRRNSDEYGRIALDVFQETSEVESDS
jgi:transcriptional regulator with XRE-family HTH domain